MSELKILFAGDTFPVAGNMELFREGKKEEIFGKKYVSFLNRQITVYAIRRAV